VLGAQRLTLVGLGEPTDYRVVSENHERCEETLREFSGYGPQEAVEVGFTVGGRLMAMAVPLRSGAIWMLLTL
jgi:hypothetical protein